MNEVCSDSKGTNKFKSRARIKTTSGATESTRLLNRASDGILKTVGLLIPRGDQTSRSQGFTNPVKVTSKKKVKCAIK
jgi:hypothetical protein